MRRTLEPLAMRADVAVPPVDHASSHGRGSGRSDVRSDIQELMRTLYVGGLPADATEDSLRTTFAKFGALEAARVVMRSTTGKCRGFGYVTFRREAEAQAAMGELDGRVVHGNRWRVDLVR